MVVQYKHRSAYRSLAMFRADSRLQSFELLARVERGVEGRALLFFFSHRIEIPWPTPRDFPKAFDATVAICSSALSRNSISHVIERIEVWGASFSAS